MKCMICGGQTLPGAEAVPAVPGGAATRPGRHDFGVAAAAAPSRSVRVLALARHRQSSAAGAGRTAGGSRRVALATTVERPAARYGRHCVCRCRRGSDIHHDARTAGASTFPQAPPRCRCRRQRRMASRRACRPRRCSATPVTRAGRRRSPSIQNYPTRRSRSPRPSNARRIVPSGRRRQQRRLRCCSTRFRRQCPRNLR